MYPTVQSEICQTRNPPKPMTCAVENGPEIVSYSYVRMGGFGPETAQNRPMLSSRPRHGWALTTV
jgi:hypothetical protein